MLNFLLDYNRIGGYIKSMKVTAQTLKALSDETRLRILCLLMDNELCVCDIMAALQLRQSTVSRHLAYLKNTGWVDDRRTGIWVYYSISVKNDEFKKQLLEALEMHLPSSKEALQDRQKLAEFSSGNVCA